MFKCSHCLDQVLRRLFHLRLHRYFIALLPGSGWTSCSLLTKLMLRCIVEILQKKCNSYLNFIIFIHIHSSDKSLVIISFIRVVRDRIRPGSGRDKFLFLLVLKKV